MTSLAEPGQRTGWRARLVWIALALSLTLNVFFVGGLTWMKLSAHPPVPPMERMMRIAQALDLTDDQRLALDQFMRVIRLRGRFQRESNQPLLERIWAELAKPAPDDDAIAKLGAEIEQNRAAFQHEAAAALLTFVKTLTPEQRTKLADATKAATDPPARRLFELIAP
jgi:Spy/CpxP family protein refolding chaperone